MRFFFFLENPPLFVDNIIIVCDNVVTKRPRKYNR